MWQNIREFILRTAGLFNRNRREQELSEELEFHLALKQAQYQKGGAGPAESTHRARQDFGGLERWKERCRDASTIRPLEDLRRDLRLAIRMLRKSPTFTCVAVATLAAAISANTTIFSLMNAVLLKSVEVPRPDRLALLRIHPGEYGYAFNYPWFKRIEKESSSLMQTFAFAGRALRLKTGSGAEDLPTQLVSGSYFSALKVAPVLGRSITPQDDRPGTPDGEVAVLSGAFWRSRFGSDPNILGRKLIINQTVFTIIGIMPDSFRGMDRDQRPGVFIPLESEPLIDAPFNSIAAGYQVWWMRIGARLRDGVSLEQAEAFLKANSRAIMQGKEMPPNFNFSGYKLSDLYLTAESGLAGYSLIRLRFAKPLEVLMVLVGLVLLVACLNLATLLIARAAARRREFSTRFALGASRFRLVRQLLTECLLLSLAGTAIGLPAALLLTRTLALLIAPQHEISSAQLDTTPDPIVFAFTAAIVVIATLATGVAPAFRSTGRELQNGPGESSSTLRPVERRRLWPHMLLAMEVAAALVLVTGASLLGYSFLKLHQLPLGFDAAGLVHLTIDTGHETLRRPLPEMYRQITRRLQSLPSVSDVSICQVVPFSGSIAMTAVAVPGKSQQPLWQNAVGPGYFRTMRTSLREGREFRWSDTGAAGRVAILNSSAEKALFPGGHALGQRVTNDGGKTMLEVIGIVDDTKYSSVRDASPPVIYFPAMSFMDSRAPSFTFLLRTSGPAAPLIASATKLIHQNVPEIPLPVAITMQDTLNESLASERVLTILATFFGILALAITGIGLYGTLAYMTERRTGEIGIRIALGARPRNIAWLVCAENGAIALSGCAAGLIASLMASKLIASFLFGVTPRDPLALGAAVVALLIVIIAASVLPAAKATRIDPIAAIRHE
jgi:predicted permease